MAIWKIFYTDGSSLSHRDVPSVLDIPKEKRIGVHSVIQPFQSNTMREVLESAFYMYLQSSGAWVMTGTDGLLDNLTSQFNNIECILHGRIQSTDEFWSMKRNIQMDEEIIGAISLDQFNHPATRAFQPWLYWRIRETYGEANARVQ